MALISQIRQIGKRGPGRTKFVLAGPRGVRRGAVLRRQHDHAGDLGALGGRGDEDDLVLDGRLVIPITVTIIVLLFRDPAAAAPAPSGACSGRSCSSGSRPSPSLGIRGITMHPEVLEALSPSYAFDFLFQQRIDRLLRARPPWCWRSPGSRRSTPTWVTSGAPRSPAPGCCSSSRRAS